MTGQGASRTSPVDGVFVDFSIEAVVAKTNDLFGSIAGVGFARWVTVGRVCYE